MAKGTIKMTVEVDGLKATLQRLRTLPKVAQDEIRVAAQRIADTEAERIRARGQRTSRLAALAAQSVRSRKDRTPVIVAGGTKKLPGGRGTYGDIFFGAEFGGGRRKTTQQFEPHQGREGYWFWPQLREDQALIFDEWGSVVDAVAREWEAG